jgi:hypothetical protein
MDNFGSRTVLILAGGVLIIMLGWGLLITQMAYQAVEHCAYQSQKLTCTPADKG